MQNFEVLNGIIKSIIDGSFNFDMLPFYRHCDGLRQEAEIFIILYPAQAKQYLAQGKIEVYNTRLMIIDHLSEVDEKTEKKLKIMEVALIKLYDSFSELLLEIENPKS